MRENELSYSGRMWRLLYPILTYMGIYYVIYMLGTILAMAFGVVNIKSGGSSLDYYVLMEQTMNNLDGFTYPISIVTALFTIPVEYLYMSRDNARWENVFPVYEHPAIFPWYLITPVLGAAVCLALNNMMKISGLFTAYSENLSDVQTVLYRGQLVMEVIYLVFLGPIMEELIFRGVIQRRIRAFSNANVAIISTAILFGCYHANMLQAVYGAILGLVLGYVFEKYQCYGAAIGVHMGANLAAVILSETSLANAIGQDDRILMGTTVLACVVIFGCMYVIYHFVEPTLVHMPGEDRTEEPGSSDL